MQMEKAVKPGTPIQRVTFHEITKKAVKAAFEHAHTIDSNLVDAQQTRRVLDRLVGYQISPLLWDKVRRGLSAGRVQTVALRLIVEREHEIAAFKPTEYWNIEAVLAPAGGGQEFVARFIGTNGQAARVADVFYAGKWIANALPDGATTEKVVAELERAAWSVRNVERKETRQFARPPYTTSKLQQDGARVLGFNVRRTMGVAQRLYEGIELGAEGTVGLITYMRTDSTRMSPDAVTAIREYVAQRFGKNFMPDDANTFRTKSDAQDAHEAIRPTDVALTPEKLRKYLSDEQFKLYQLIWERAVASQMAPAVFDQTTVEIDAKSAETYNFRSSGRVLKFAGYLSFQEERRKQAVVRAAQIAADEGEEISEEDAEDLRLPDLNDGQGLAKQRVEAKQKATQPPPRYNEASLVKTLEEKGIGRPSTYASIINTIQDREYVKKIARKFVPTEVGVVVTDLLVKNFPYIFKYEYTAQLESELDAVEEGREKWTDLLKGFYSYFEKELHEAAHTMEEIKRMERPTTEKCERCGAPLVLKWGKFGSFFSCSNYSKAKPITVSATAWKKHPKNVVKKITEAFSFPVTVKTLTGHDVNFTKQVEAAAGLTAAIEEAFPQGKKVVAEGFSCGFTKENVADKPDLTAPGANEAEQEEEFCDNCGRQMVLKNGPFGPFMSCPGYNEDPPCRTIRKLTQKVQQKPPVVLDEKCPKCGKPLLKREGQYGEFIACSGFPKCKYVKQNLLDVKCPLCGGDVAERKARTGNTFYGCTNYPKCSFTSNQKLLDQKCPKCGSPYLLELVNKEGVFLVCPNNTDALPKRRPKKGAAAAEKKPAKACSYEKRTGDAPPPPEPKKLTVPDPETVRPLAETTA
jgi:DNA topoisomerase-1